MPVGTNRGLAERLPKRAGRTIDVASNPEFLKEGAALDDFMKPDRVVVGVRRPEVAEVLHELYGPFLRTERPFLVMSPESAEMTKYAANAMLATKISFINEMANLCERSAPTSTTFAAASATMSRIGFQFLFPGPGYGGSLLSQGRPRHHRHGPSRTVVPAGSDRSGRRGQRSAESRCCFAKDSRSTSASNLQGKTWPSGAWPSSRAPTTSAKRRP